MWAIRFEFIADLEVLGLSSSAVVGLYSDSQSQTNSSLAIPSPTGSIHQASLSQLGVYSDSDNEANSKAQTLYQPRVYTKPYLMKI